MLYSYIYVYIYKFLFSMQNINLVKYNYTYVRTQFFTQTLSFSLKYYKFIEMRYKDVLSFTVSLRDPLNIPTNIINKRDYETPLFYDINQFYFTTEGSVPKQLVRKNAISFWKLQTLQTVSVTLYILRYQNKNFPFSFWLFSCSTKKLSKRLQMYIEVAFDLLESLVDLPLHFPMRESHLHAKVNH